MLGSSYYVCSTVLVRAERNDQTLIVSSFPPKTQLWLNSGPAQLGYSAGVLVARVKRIYLRFVLCDVRAQLQEYFSICIHPSDALALPLFCFVAVGLIIFCQQKTTRSTRELEHR